MRASGILMHISSLPSAYGIGSMGKEAYRFADFLKAAKQHFWQILPIGPTGYGDSPYQSCCSNAGNPYLIDVDLLVEDGLLTQEEAASARFDGERVDYAWLYRTRFDLLRCAYRRGWKRDAQAVNAFIADNSWVRDYGLFMAIKNDRNETWDKWPEPLRRREAAALLQAEDAYREQVDFYIYIQFLFFRQWQALRAYLKEQSIEVIGDIPIYVPYDSVDVWVHPELFQLDENGKPTAVAGCPPDGFSADGQLWGNPLYDWERMEQDGFRWWMAHIGAAAKCFDVIRIDHFRGLESYWSVPYGDKTAVNGCWRKGPGKAFIDTLHREYPTLKLIAEDLGFLTQAVIDLQKHSGFPGMKVLEFAFDPREPSNYLPHSYEENAVCYTGTHDNETLYQWLANAPKENIAFAMKYLKVEREEALGEAILEAGMQSKANWFIAPMQDYLGLGEEARMNEPSTLSTKNWSWRMKDGALTSQLAEHIAAMTVAAKRNV